jgi:hypothetical protein
VFFARHYLDRFLGRIGAKSAEDAAANVLASVGDDADRARLESVEELADWFRDTAEMVAKLEARRADVEAGIVRKIGPPKWRVRSVAKMLSDVKPKLDPAAPRPAERTGRRGGAPLVQPGAPEAEGRWLRGMVLTWNPRTWEGSVRAADGMEYRLAVGVLARSGLVTLVPGMKAEFKIVANECDQIKAAWH